MALGSKARVHECSDHWATHLSMFLFLSFIFMCMCVLPAFMSVYHMVPGALGNQKRTQIPGAGVGHSCELTSGCWGSRWGP